MTLASTMERNRMMLQLIEQQERIQRVPSTAKYESSLTGQGPWLFLPVGRLRVKANDILWSQPLDDIEENPHVVDFLYRDGFAIYVKGRVSHPDYKTVVLTNWHRLV